MAGNRLFSFLADMPPPTPRAEIVEGLLAEGEVMLLTGAPGAGKSAIAAQLAACVSADRPFAGREVCQGPIVYIALERAASMRRRLEAAKCDPACSAVLSKKLDLDLAKDATRLAEELIEVDPLIVFIDTAAHAMPDLDENSAKDMGKIVRGIRVLQEDLPSAAIVLVHHLDKAGRSARGSSALQAAVDIELRVERPDASSAVRIAKVVKSNELPEGATIAFTLVNQNGLVVAVPCDLPAGRAKARPAIADRNAQKQAEADTKAKALLDACPAAFTLDQAVMAGDQAGLFGSIEDGSKRKAAHRHLTRLVKNGAVSHDGETYQKRNFLHATDGGQAVSSSMSGSARSSGSCGTQGLGHSRRRSMRRPPHSHRHFQAVAPGSQGRAHQRRQSGQRSSGQSGRHPRTAHLCQCHLGQPQPHSRPIPS